MIGITPLEAVAKLKIRGGLLRCEEPGEAAWHLEYLDQHLADRDHILCADFVGAEIGCSYIAN